MISLYVILVILFKIEVLIYLFLVFDLAIQYILKRIRSKKKKKLEGLSNVN